MTMLTCGWFWNDITIIIHTKHHVMLIMIIKVFEDVENIQSGDYDIGMLHLEKTNNHRGRYCHHL